MIMPDQTHFRSRSFWMETAPYEPGPSLMEDSRVDVAIVGGGFGGLWTAYHLKRAEPSLAIAVVEREVIGYGASGRNGGFAMTLVQRSLGDLLEAYGPEEALAVHRAMAEAVDGIGRFSKEHAVDCDFEKNGVLTVSTAPWQDASIEADVRAAKEIGLDDLRFLDAPVLQEMVHSPIYRCGELDTSSAILNPAKLSWGIARVLREQGVAIYEGTEVRGLRRRPDGADVQTSGPTLRAEHVVMTTNAYSVQFPGIRRWVVPIYTYIVLTEPLTDAQWRAIGWSGREGIEDRMGGFHYYRPTADGRIAWGGEIYPYHFGSRIASEFDRDESAFQALRTSLVRTFPPLAGVNFTHAWGGPVAITARWLATFGTERGGHVHHGIGHCGHGVATTYLGGEILRDLVLDRDTDRTKLCFAWQRPFPFPPEPLRYLTVQSSVKTMVDQDRKGRVAKPSMLERMLLRPARQREKNSGG
jgi:glycine/D-amino acid oxidase-like deaminating enzyme